VYVAGHVIQSFALTDEQLAKQTIRVNPQRLAFRRNRSGI